MYVKIDKAGIGAYYALVRGLFQGGVKSSAEEKRIAATVAIAPVKRTRLRLLTEHEESNRAVNAAREHFLARCQEEKDRPIERKRKGSLLQDLFLCLCLAVMVFVVVGVIQYSDQLMEIWRALLARVDVL